MTDIQQISIIAQRNVEKMFAASVNTFPLEAVRECGWIKDDDIFDERIRAYWREVKNTVTPTMDGQQAFDAAVTAALHNNLLADLAEWQSDAGFLAHPTTYASDLSRKRAIVDASVGVSELQKAVSSQDWRNVRNVIEGLYNLRAAEAVKMMSTIDIADKFAELVDSGNRIIPTYLPPLDAAIGGVQRKELTIIGARPSVGKTALMLQIARSAANESKHIHFYSLEMSAESLWARIVCQLANTTWMDVRRGKVSQETKDLLKEKSYLQAAKYAEHFKIIDTPQTTQTIWQSVAQHRPDVVYVDHMRLLRDQADSEVKRMGAISQQLKEISKAFDCAVVAAAQLNRKLEDRADKRPTLADLRDSGEIEENADTILMMYRDSLYSEEKPPELDTVELLVRKFRDGARELLIAVKYDTKRQWFERIGP